MLEAIVLALIISAVFGEDEVSIEKLRNIARHVDSLEPTWTTEMDSRVSRADTGSSCSVRTLSGNSKGRSQRSIWSRFVDFIISPFSYKRYDDGDGDDDESDEGDVELPDNFDSRGRWPECPSISHIYDQGNCESCWAVSVVSAFADRICIKSKGKLTLPRSSQHVISCCSSCGNGCGSPGGYDMITWSYLKRSGVVTGGDYGSMTGCQPYQIKPCAIHEQPQGANLPRCDSLLAAKKPKCKHHCYNKDYNTDYKADKIKAKDVYPISGERAAQIEIYKRGPIITTMRLYEDFLSYKSGIYSYGNMNGWYIGRHSVRVIGWGVEKNVKYWLVANSWNTGWGENGTGRILRGHQSSYKFEASFSAGVVDPSGL